MLPPRCLPAILSLLLLIPACTGIPDRTPSTTPAVAVKVATAPTVAATPGPNVQAKVVRVVDGDTIDVEIEGKRYTVRYIGIDTPETVDPRRPVEAFGKEASEKNKEMVAGKTVTLEKDVSETDRYGRLLRYVYVDSTFVNAELVRQGFAQVATYPPDVKYADRFRQLQKEARAAGRGLWGLESGTPAS